MNKREFIKLCMAGGLASGAVLSTWGISSIFKLFASNSDFYGEIDGEIVHLKKNPYEIPKVAGEVRIVSVDIATRANSANDNSIIICTRLIPSKKAYMGAVIIAQSFLKMVMIAVTNPPIAPAIIQGV